MWAVICIALVACVAVPIKSAVTPEVLVGYKTTFIDLLDSGLNCHAEYKRVPSAIIKAADACAARADIASFSCFLICAYRGFGVIDSKSDRLDLDQSDMLTKEAFNTDNTPGQISYLTVSKDRLICSKSTKNGESFLFTRRFDDDEACEATKDFFQCEVGALACEKDKYKEAIKKHLAT